VRRIFSGRFDAVLVQGYQPISCLSALLAARLCGSRVFFRGESCLRDRDEIGGLKTGLKRTILKSVFSLSDIVFYSCPGNHRFFRHFGCPEEKLAPIPCAVDNAYFRKMRLQYGDKQDEIRSDLGVASNTPVVLNIGRVAGLKRQTDLLDAITLLQRDDVEVATIFVGDGPGLPALRETARRRNLRDVHFVGFMNQSDVGKFYSIADIFTTCSEFDPSPKVINEALNFELPIVSSDRPGQIGDTIVHDLNARIYPCGDTQRLASDLRMLIRDSSKRAELGRQSLRLADRFSIAADVRSVENVLSKVCSTHDFKPLEQRMRAS
jgi:glycosyltransferase involved in cell wall biosynthesis